MQIGDVIEQHGWKAISLIGTVLAGVYTYGVYDGRREITHVQQQVEVIDAKVDTVIEMLKPRR